MNTSPVRQTLRTTRSTLARVASSVGLATVVTLAAAVGEVRAGTIDSTAFTISTTGAIATGSARRTSDSTGAMSYAIAFNLRDSGNEGRPVYVRYRWQLLVSATQNDLSWATTPTSTYFNRNGYGTAVSGTISRTSAQVQTMAANMGNQLPQAVKLRAQISVCRDNGTTADNCSSWWSQTWNTYPSTAFRGSFLCNGNVLLVDIDNFVDPAYVPFQTAPFNLTVVITLVETNSTMTSLVTRSSIVRIVNFPAPGVAPTQSFVWQTDPATNTLVLDDGYDYFMLTPGKYYAVTFQAYVNNIVAGEQPATSWAIYAIQNGWMQGTPGDFKCLATAS